MMYIDTPEIFRSVRMVKKSNNTDNLEKCYVIMARIVGEYGDIALPIFQRLHEEREKRISQQDWKTLALTVAKMA